MKSQMKLFYIIGVVLFIAGTSVAGDTLKQFGEKKGRTYHADLYEENSCDSCHTNGTLQVFPPDFVCFDCHDGDKLIKATSRPGDDKWQNPHNSMHYGQDVPCMECHGEHQENKLLCAGCHSFDYPNYEK